jgi:protein-S-isoprenylcysteine O-methyltransferase Ste14
MYTGLLLGALGTAILVNRLHSLFGVGVLFVGLWIKSRMEEQFMVEEFGDQYREYQKRVKALVPYIF